MDPTSGCFLVAESRNSGNEKTKIRVRRITNLALVRLWNNVYFQLNPKQAKANVVHNTFLYKTCQKPKKTSVVVSKNPWKPRWWCLILVSLQAFFNQNSSKGLFSCLEFELSKRSLQIIFLNITASMNLTCNTLCIYFATKIF